MKIIITGGTGLLGRALTETANSDYEIIATYLGEYKISDTKQVKYKKLDIKNKEGYVNLFKDFMPHVVIHAAGINSPDYAEKNKEEARAINIGGAQNILQACRDSGAKFIYISSNGIYDGNNAPYSEADKAEPVNYYGWIKLEGEKITESSGITWAIVRPILMYGWNYPFERPNIVTLAISKLRKGEQIFVYDDVYSIPLFYYSCADAIWKIIEKGKYEIFNIGGRDRVSIYEFIKQVARIFGLQESLIVPVKQGFFKELAKRPRDTSYKTTKMEHVLGIEPLSVEKGLEIMKIKEG